MPFISHSCHQSAVVPPCGAVASSSVEVVLPCTPILDRCRLDPAITNERQNHPLLPGPGHPISGRLLVWLGFRYSGTLPELTEPSDAASGWFCRALVGERGSFAMRSIDGGSSVRSLCGEVVLRCTGESRVSYSGGRGGSRPFRMFSSARMNHRTAPPSHPDARRAYGSARQNSLEPFDRIA